jgi:hypothetical protein
MKVIFVLYFLFFLLYTNVSNAQDEYFSALERTSIITAQLSNEYKQKMKNLELDEKKADELMDIADNYYKQLATFRLEANNLKDKRKLNKLYRKMVKVENKAIESRIESLDHYHDVAVQKYQIYKNDLQKFMKSGEKEKVDTAKAWEKIAYDVFEKADVKVHLSYHTVNHGDLFDIYTTAYKLEQIGLLYEEKIYGLFLGWSEINSNRISEEISALYENKPLNSPKAENTLAEVHSIKDSIIYKEIVVYDTVTVNNNTTDFVFRVQIAASKEPLSITDLRKIYHADDIINTVIESGWYKYTVGIFDTYREAKKFKLNIGVSDAFVVAYLKGKKVEISDAVKQNTD